MVPYDRLLAVLAGHSHHAAAALPGQQPSKYTSETFLDIRARLKTLDPFSEEALVQYDRFNELFHDDPWLLPCAPFRA